MNMTINTKREHTVHPMISVIVPVYNVEKYLRGCLDSVLNQTFTDFEVICVNDGSTDSSPEILAEYQKKGVRVISQKNQGLSMARNVGLKSAVGTYVYFLDSDDSLHPQALECLSGWAVKYGADLVVSSFQRVKGAPTKHKVVNCHKVPVKLTYHSLKLLKDKWMFHISINAWGKLYKKTLIEPLAFIPGIYFEDFPYTVCLMKKHPKTVVSRVPLYYYTENDNSITHSNWSVKKLTDYCVGLDAIFECYQDNPKELNYIKNYFFPKIIKQAFNCTFRYADDETLVQVLRIYQQYFIRLREKGLMSFRGHKVTRYWAYRKLMAAKDVSGLLPMMKRIFK